MECLVQDIDLLTEESNLNYRELQGIAKKLGIPGNLKYRRLLEAITARKSGDERKLEMILDEQKKEREKRRHEKFEGREVAYRHLYMQKKGAGRPRKHPRPEELAMPLQLRFHHKNYRRPCCTPTPQATRAVSQPYSTPEAYQHHFMSLGNYPYMNLEWSSQNAASPSVFNTSTPEPNSSFPEFGHPTQFSTHPWSYYYGSSQQHQTVRRTSFQIKDILSESHSYTSYQTYMSTGEANEFIPSTETEGQYLNQRSDLVPFRANMTETPSDDNQQGSQIRETCSNYHLSGGRILENTSIQSPSSDTMSAPDQELDYLFGPGQDLLSEFRNQNQVHFPILYNYLGSEEQQIPDGEILLPTRHDVSVSSEATESFSDLPVSSPQSHYILPDM